MKKKLYLIKVVFLTFKSILKKKPRKTYELKIAKMHLYFILNQNRQVCTLQDPPPPFRQNQQPKKKKRKREERKKDKLPEQKAA